MILGYSNYIKACIILQYVVDLKYKLIIILMGDSMDLILIALIIICLTVVVFCIRTVLHSQETQKANKEFLNKVQNKGFEVSKYVEHGVYALAVDDKNLKWCIKYNNERATKIFDYNDLIDFELYQDGESIAKNNTVGALVGGALFGIAGAVGAQKKLKGVCTMLQLRIRVNNLNMPEITIKFIDSPIKKDSRIYKNIFDKSKETAAILTYIQNKENKRRYDIEFVREEKE